MKDIETRTLDKVTRHLLPYLFLLYMIAYLDRVNVGFAQLQMKGDLGFSDDAFANGAGIFFLGYMLFQVPSNVMLEKLGARKLISTIMVLWGLVSTAMMLMRDAQTFYVLRFFLGVAEAGFFPGIILYLTYWFPARHRARAVSLFMLAIPVSSILGSPISGKILEMDDILGLQGWHWLFLLEGLPAVLLGLVSLNYLADGPRDVSWLTPEEVTWLTDRLEQERREAEASRARSSADTLGSVFAHPACYLLGLIYFLLSCSFYAISFWSPQIVKSLAEGAREGTVGWLNAIPYVGGGIGMLLVGRSSDQSHERHYHVALSALLAAVCFELTAVTLDRPVLAMLFLTLASAGLWATVGPFWAIPPMALSGRGVAAGIAFINSVGAIGGWAGPKLLAYAKNNLGGYAGGFFLLALMLTLGAAMVFARPVRPQRVTSLPDLS